MRATSWLAILAACGGGSSSAPSAPRAGAWTAPEIPKAERTIDAWTPADEDVYVRHACANIVGPDGTFRCPVLAKAGLEASRCAESFGALGASATDDKSRRAFRLVVAGLSLAESCEVVAIAFQVAAKSMTEDAGADGCRRRADGSYDLTAEAVLQRRGLGDRVFGDTPSSPDEPIEVCGLLGETQWLTKLTCADGSRPWGRDLDKAHGARRGTVDGKGRCGALAAIVDHYRVPRPEKTHDVYMDMYQCGPGESLWRGIKRPGG